MPNMTPIFSRIWLMKITQVFDLLIVPESLRSACDISRACRPTSWSPISPSISAFGTSAATESTTITSTALLRTRSSATSSACSPLSGCETSRSSTSTPSLRVLGVEGVLRVNERRRAAGLLRVGDDVDAPASSCPRIPARRSRSRGRAARRRRRAPCRSETEPVGIMPTSKVCPAPRRITAPLPNCRSDPARRRSPKP